MGKLEVCGNGEWRIVCPYLWVHSGNNDLVCSQLGRQLGVDIVGGWGKHQSLLAGKLSMTNVL